MSELMFPTESESVIAMPVRLHDKTKVLIVDSHPIVRDGLRRLLEQQEDMVCCGEAATTGEAMGAVTFHRPDVVILDPRLKRGNGLELIKALKAKFADLAILVLSHYAEASDVEGALSAGAGGYLVKERACNQIIDAIRSVRAGQIFVAVGDQQGEAGARG